MNATERQRNCFYLTGSVNFVQLTGDTTQRKDVPVGKDTRICFTNWLKYEVDMITV